MAALRILLLLSLFAVLATAQVPLNLSQDEIRALLEQVMSNQHRMDSQFSEYTSTGKQITRWYDKQGKVKGESVLVSESYQSARRNVEIVLSKNGKPYSEGKIKKEREQAVKKLSEDEQWRAQNTKAATDSKSELGMEYGLDNQRIVRLSSYEIFRSCDFFNARNGQLDGREMILLDFRPRPDFVPRERPLNPLKHLAGTVWIDATDKVTAKLLAYLATDQERKKPAYQLVSMRMPDGAWLYTRSGFNASLNPEIFNGLNLEVVFERSNYQRFTVQSGEVKLDAPKQKP